MGDVQIAQYHFMHLIPFSKIFCISWQFNTHLRTNDDGIQTTKNGLGA